jgi:hypothetical protein
LIKNVTYRRIFRVHPWAQGDISFIGIQVQVVKRQTANGNISFYFSQNEFLYVNTKNIVCTCKIISTNDI